MLTLVSIIVVVVVLFLSKALFGTYFSPLSVYCSIWMGVLFLISLNFLGYVSASQEAWQLIWLSQIAFMLGCLPASLLWKKVSNNNQVSGNLRSAPSPKKDSSEIASGAKVPRDALLGERDPRLKNTIFESGSVSAPKRDACSTAFANLEFFQGSRNTLSAHQHVLQQLIVIFTCLAALGILAKWLILFRLFESLPQIINNLGDFRLQLLEGQFAFPFWTDFLSFFMFPATIFVGILLPISPKYRLWAGCLIGLLFINDMSTASRGTTVHGFLLLANAYLLSLFTNTRFRLNRLLSWKWIAVFLAFVMLIVALHGIRFVRERPLGVSGFASFLEDAFRVGYLYLTGPIPALSEILKSEPAGTGFGSYSLGGLYRLLNMLLGFTGVGPVFPLLPSRSYVFIPQPFNTYPYIWYLYADFGFAGILLVPYFIGWISAMVFFHYKARGQLFALVLLSIIFTYLEFTPRDTITNWISFWFELVSALSLSLYLQRGHKTGIVPRRLSRPALVENASR